MNERLFFRREVGRFFRDILTRPGWKLLAIGILFPVTLEWAATSTYYLLVRALENHVKAYLWWVAILPFGIALCWSYREAVKLSKSRRILDREVTDRDCRAMIIFLSPIRADAALVKEFLEDNGRLDLRDLRTRERFKGPWRMPLEAIAYHLRAPGHVVLERMMVLTSRETNDMFGDFKRLVKKLTTEADIRVEHIAHFNEGAYANGLNFLDPRLLEEAIEHTFSHFRRQSIKERDVLLDITGGFKTTSIVGAIVALKDTRRIQYVENDYKVRFFDLNYEETGD